MAQMKNFLTQLEKFEDIHIYNWIDMFRQFIKDHPNDNRIVMTSKQLIDDLNDYFMFFNLTSRTFNKLITEHNITSIKRKRCHIGENRNKYIYVINMDELKEFIGNKIMECGQRCDLIKCVKGFDINVFGGLPDRYKLIYFSKLYKMSRQHNNKIFYVDWNGQEMEYKDIEVMYWDLVFDDGKRFIKRWF